MSDDPRDELKHPNQPVGYDGRNVIRFKANAIVRWMLDMGGVGVPFDLNTIARQDFSDEDRMQLAQLIGYSVSGYGDLSYVSPRNLSTADRRADKVSESKNLDSAKKDSEAPVWKRKNRETGEWEPV